jgi:hypothetical protein
MVYSTDWSNSIPIFPVVYTKLIPLIRCGGGPVHLKVLMLLYHIPYTYNNVDRGDQTEEREESKGRYRS